MLCPPNLKISPKCHKACSLPWGLRKLGWLGGESAMCMGWGAPNTQKLIRYEGLFILQCFFGHPCYVCTPFHGSSVIDGIRPTLEHRIWLPSLMLSDNLPTNIPPPASTLLANQSIQIFSGNPLSSSLSPGMMRRDNMIFATINRVLDALHYVRSSCCRLREWNLLQNVNGHGCEYVIWP